MLIELSDKDTFVHRFDPRSKLAVAVAFTIISFFLSAPSSIAVLLFVVILYGVIGRVYPWEYKKIIIVLVPFALGITLIQIFVNMATNPFPAIDFLGIAIPLRGFERGLVISLRAFVLAISFGLFMMTTPPTDITNAADRMGVPFNLAYMISFGLRFIPLFEKDFQKIRQAQISRGMEESSFGPVAVIMSMPALLVPLIMTSVRHAQMLAIALEMRGLSTATEYGRTYMKEINMRPADWIVLSFSILGTLSLAIARFAGLT